jgi:hypothetical protein
MRERWVVVCEDQQIRHKAPFANKAEAEQFAEYGHCCTNNHDINQMKGKLSEYTIPSK